MIGIPLRDVVAFLRPHGALGVIDGAPFFYSNGPKDPPLMPIPGTGMGTWSGEPVRLLGYEHHAMLYLGTSKICPAAEGWAARVLALARGYDPVARTIEDDCDHITLWSSGCDEYDYRWGWDASAALPFEGGSWVDLPRRAPNTPAARLAAVLHYEMERAK